MISKDNITGVILTGGEGRRVSGKDKGLLVYKGISLIKRQIDWLLPQVASVLISANRNIAHYQKLGYPVLLDQYNEINNLSREEIEFNGPLYGIYEALRKCSTQWLFVQPVDLPNLPVELLETLLKNISSEPLESENCFYLKSNQREHYLSMLINKSVGDQLRKYLENNLRRVRDFHLKIGSRSIDLNLNEKVFKNLNFENEYE